MGDIKNRKLLYTKGVLFLALGLAASVLIVVENPRWTTALLVAVAVWAFARAYYFAFYVVEHYVDGQFKFSGLLAFARYLLKSRR